MKVRLGATDVDEGIDAAGFLSTLRSVSCSGRSRRARSSSCRSVTSPGSSVVTGRMQSDLAFAHLGGAGHTDVRGDPLDAAPSLAALS